jgi:hypothetical protein
MFDLGYGHILMILFNQSNVPPNILIRNKGYVNGDKRRLQPVSFKKLLQAFIQSLFIFKKI